MLLGSGLMIIPIISANSLETVDSITVNVEARPDLGEYVYDFKGMGPANTGLGLLEFDGQNSWILVTATTSDADGNYVIRVVYQPSNAGLEKTFKVRQSAVLLFSNELTLTIGDGFGDNPDLPTFYDVDGALPFVGAVIFGVGGGMYSV